MDENLLQRYEKFTSSRQEPLRLEIALADFFRPELPAAFRAAYGQYLQWRAKPALTALIAADDVPRITQLAALGWLDRRLTDEGISAARSAQKAAALVWLLRWKQRQYGYPDRDFSL